MFGVFGSQLLSSAATLFAKKAFEASVAQSLRGIGEAINTRFKGNVELLQLKDELECKMKMLSLPVDICAHWVTQGNTALQEALGVALRVLQQIEQFQTSLVQHDISKAQREPASPDTAATTARHIKELRALISSLDSLLPYLNLAISAAGLLASAEPSAISPSRLMSASWRLRSAAITGAPVYSIQQAAWHEERQLSAAGPSMMEAYPLCSLAVLAGPAGVGDFELVVRQSLEDGRHHEENEQPGETRIQVSSIVGIEWGTTQSLGQGTNEYKPALVLHVAGPSMGSSNPGASYSAAKPPTPPSTYAGVTPPPGLSTRSSSRQGRAERSSRALEGEQADCSASSSAAAAAAKTTTAAAAKSTTAAAATASAPPPGALAGPSGNTTPVAMGLGCTADSAACTAIAASGTVRRYAIQCSWQPVGPPHSREEGDGEEEQGGSEDGEELLEREGSAQLAEAPSSEEWAALGELEHVLRLGILESMEGAPHYTIQDERIRMAFEETTVLPSAPSAVGGAGGVHSRPSTARRGTLARRSGLAGVASGTAGTAGGRGSSSAEVDAMAAELNRRLAFFSGSGDAGQGGNMHGRRGFGSPLV